MYYSDNLGSCIHVREIVHAEAVLTSFPPVSLMSPSLSMYSELTRCPLKEADDR